MGFWITLVAVLCVLPGMVTIAACIASARFNRSGEILVDDMREPAGTLVLTPAPSEDL